MSRSPAQPTHHARRAGFTLLELIVVIMIIGILVGLLMAGINSAVSSARRAEVVTEISQLEKAIAEFKLHFGIDPPSYFVFYEEGEHWADSDAEAASHGEPSPRHSREILRKLWPNFLYANNEGPNVDLNGDGDTDDVFILNGAECLVFFLGGVTRRVDLNGDGIPDFVTYGFSTNPSNPFEVELTSTGTVGSNRISFFEFKPERLVDIDGDGMPEYLDPIPNQRYPYLYFSSYNGAGYRPLGLDGILNSPAPNEGPDDETLLDAAGNRLGVAEVYYRVPPPSNPGDPPAVYWNPQSFQIISPGFDGEYGQGGLYDGERAETPAERDNITNFKGGQLN